MQLRTLLLAGMLSISSVVFATDTDIEITPIIQASLLPQKNDVFTPVVGKLMDYTPEEINSFIKEELPRLTHLSDYHPFGDSGFPLNKLAGGNGDRCNDAEVLIHDLNEINKKELTLLADFLGFYAQFQQTIVREGGSNFSLSKSSSPSDLNYTKNLMALFQSPRHAEDEQSTEADRIIRLNNTFKAHNTIRKAINSIANVATLSTADLYTFRRLVDKLEKLSQSKEGSHRSVANYSCPEILSSATLEKKAGFVEQLRAARTRVWEKLSLSEELLMPMQGVGVGLVQKNKFNDTKVILNTTNDSPPNLRELAKNVVHESQYLGLEKDPELTIFVNFLTLSLAIPSSFPVRKELPKKYLLNAQVFLKKLYPSCNFEDGQIEEILKMPQVQEQLRFMRKALNNPFDIKPYNLGLFSQAYGKLADILKINNLELEEIPLQESNQKSKQGWISRWFSKKN